MKKSITKILAVAMLAILYSLPAISQDMIVTKGNRHITCKVKRITPKKIKYVYKENHHRKVVTIPASDVDYIVYENGDKRIIEANDISSKRKAKEITRKNMRSGKVGEVFNYHGPELTKEQVCVLFFNNGEIHISSIDGVIVHYPKRNTWQRYGVILLPGEHVIEGYIQNFHIYDKRELHNRNYTFQDKISVEKTLSFSPGRYYNLYPILSDYDITKLLQNHRNYHSTPLTGGLDIGLRVTQKLYSGRIPLIY